MQGAEAFAMVMTTGMFFTMIYAVTRLIINRPSRRLPPPPSGDPLLQERLDRLESAIQAIAIETERIAEGQRFTTRLLSQAAAHPAQIASAPLSPGVLATPAAANRAAG